MLGFCTGCRAERVRFADVAKQQANANPEHITGAKIALIGAIVAAIVGATATITAALLQHKESFPTVVTVVPPIPGPNPKVFDKAALEGEDGVKKILIGSYGLQADQIVGLTCPADQEVKAGNNFTCTFQLRSGTLSAKVVDIAVVDDNGQYQVGPPRDR